MTVIYPQMSEEFTPRYLNLLLSHLDACKDVCDHFGITTTLLPYQKDRKVVGFTVKSFRNPNKKDADEFDFPYDPFWDDGTDFEALYKGIDDEDMPTDPYPKIENKVPDNDEELIETTKKWVGALISDMGVCPFSQGPDKAGLPIGNVFYIVDRSSGFEDMYAAYWKEVSRIEMNPEKEISTTLLIAPEFCMENLELFESFTNTLTQPLSALKVEDLIQLVFFHPYWSFRDGDARTDKGNAANYARRSPWPMINILRTSQVRAAQKGIPTGLVYKQNEKTLSQVGVDKLETMLRLRDWSDTAEYKVNRKEIDALKIANDYQEGGFVKKEDTSLEYDATPAANKVDQRQIEEGNLVNVVLQALEKRLGVGSTSNNNGVTALSGPETSATALATEILIKELVSRVEPMKDTALKQSSIPTLGSIGEEILSITEMIAETILPQFDETPRQSSIPTLGSIAEELLSITEMIDETILPQSTIPNIDVVSNTINKSANETSSKEVVVEAHPESEKKQQQHEITVESAVDNILDKYNTLMEVSGWTNATSSSAASTSVNVTIEKSISSDEEEIPAEILNARRERIEAARRSIQADLKDDFKPVPTGGIGSDPNTDVLFGKGGLVGKSDEDDLFPEGMDPRSFY